MLVRAEKILIVKPSSLGDVIHSLPFLNVIRKCLPEAEIHWVIAKGLHELLEGHPMLSKLWIINKDQWKNISEAKNTIKEVRTLFRDLKNERFDLVIDLQGLLRSGFITRATKAKTRIGFKEAREGSRFFYTHKVKGGKDIHAVDRYLKIASYLGCEVSEIKFPLQVPESTYSQTIPKGDYAVLVPGARWRTKRWSPERFGKLASLLPCKSIVIGSKSDIELSDIVVENSRGKAVSLAGKTNLKELVAVIKNARFMVSNDSGPMHIAAALDVPVFALFGPTSPLRTGPYGNGHTIIKSDIPCAPCFKKNCEIPECMELITVNTVFNTIIKKLNLI